MFRRSRIEAKTPEQLLLMRRAGLVVGRTLELAASLAVPGTTTRAVDTAAEEHIRSLGATPSFLGYHGFRGSLCLSVNEEIVHGVPGDRVLAEGDLLSIDCGAIVEGWHGDAALSMVVGGREAGRPEDLALVDDTEAAMWAGIAALRTGGRLYAVGEAVENRARAAEDERRESGLELSYGVIEDYTGHGIGREMHMDPHVPNYAVQGRGPVVPAGATLAIEPMLTLGGIASHTLGDEWTVVTDDHSRAAHWEHTVAVTDGGLWVTTAIDGGQAQLAAVGVAYAPLS